MNKLIILFIIIVFVASCKRKEINSFNSSDFVQVSANELFSKIEVVPLETNMDAMIYLCRKLICTESNIFALGVYNHHVTMFDLKGNFIRNIGVKGKGPGELIDVSDFEVNRFSGNIELCGNVSSTIMVYDTLGNFIKNKTIPNSVGSVFKFSIINEDLVILLTPWNKDATINVVCTKSAEIKAKANLSIDGAYMNVLNINTPFSNYSNYLLYTDIYSGIVYSYNVEKSSFERYKEFLINDLKLDISILPSPQRWMEISHELRNEFFDKVLNYVTPNDKYLETSKYCLYQKRRTDIILTNKADNLTKTFNSIDEGINIIISGMNDDFIYGFASAKSIKNLITREIIDKNMYEMVRDLHDEDNHVLIKYYFK